MPPPERPEPERPCGLRPPRRRSSAVFPFDGVHAMRRNSPATELSDLPPAARPRERLRLIRHTRDPAAACTPCRSLHSMPQSALHAAACSPPPETMRTAATKMPVFTNPIELVRDRQAPCPGLRTKEPVLCCLFRRPPACPSPALCLCRRGLCRPNSRPGLPGDAPLRSDHLRRLRHNRAPDSARRNPCSAVSSAPPRTVPACALSPHPRPVPPLPSFARDMRSSVTPLPPAMPRRQEKGCPFRDIPFCYSVSARRPDAPPFPPGRRNRRSGIRGRAPSHFPKETLRHDTGISAWPR